MEEKEKEEEEKGEGRRERWRKRRGEKDIKCINGKIIISLGRCSISLLLYLGIILVSHPSPFPSQFSLQTDNANELHYAGIILSDTNLNDIPSQPNNVLAFFNDPAHSGLCFGSPLMIST